MRNWSLGIVMHRWMYLLQQELRTVQGLYWKCTVTQPKTTKIKLNSSWYVHTFLSRDSVKDFLSSNSGLIDRNEMDLLPINVYGLLLHCMLSNFSSLKGNWDQLFLLEAQNLFSGETMHGSELFYGTKPYATELYFSNFCS